MRPLPLVAAPLLAGCLFDGAFKHDHGTVPEDLGDGWPVGTPEDVGLSSAVLDDLHAEILREDANYGTTGLLVMRGGTLVFEAYVHDPGVRDHVQHIQSATKSVTSLALGLARERGALPDLGVTTGELFPDEVEGLEPEKAEITLEQLLTMRSGIDFSNEIFSLHMHVERPDDPLRHIFERPMYADPGEEYRYRDADPQIVTYAIERSLGMTQEKLVEEGLFQPLGIEDWYWEPLTDGTTSGAHALHLRPRDLAKVGQTVLDGGTWQGAPVVDPTWLGIATAPQVETTSLDADGEPYAAGYYWWLTPHGMAAWGHGGQFVYAIPEHDLLVVQVALPDSDDLHGSHLRDLEALVAPLLADLE